MSIFGATNSLFWFSDGDVFSRFQSLLYAWKRRMCYTFLDILNFLLDTCPILGPLIPLYHLKSQSQSGQSYSHFGGGVCDILSLRFISTALLLLVYVASIAASHLPHVHVSAQVESLYILCVTF